MLSNSIGTSKGLTGKNQLALFVCIKTSQLKPTTPSPKICERQQNHNPL